MSYRRRRPAPLFEKLALALVVVLPFACSSGDLGGNGGDPALMDSDGDGIPDASEDRNGNGKVDPGETDPHTADSDGDGIPDGSEDRNQNGTVELGETNPNSTDSDRDGIPDSGEVSVLACSPANDRPYFIYDAPGADAMLLVDARVDQHSTLRTADNRAPGLMVHDPRLDVAAVMVGKVPATGVRTPAAQRDHERRTSLAVLGEVNGQVTRAFTTVEGFQAEQARYQIRAPQPMDARTAASKLAEAMLGNVPLTGAIPAGGAQGRDLSVNLLTVMRSTRVVLVAAVAVGDNPGDAQAIRLDELTDGTNVARHGSFTRHVCDQFEAKAQAKVDIIFVIDDSCSMEDDQEAVRSAASAMGEILTSAQIDYRLGATRMQATDRNAADRGVLLGAGLTTDVQEFASRVVVGARGGWEPGLETGLLAIAKLLPRTPENEPARPTKLREGAATVIIHLSDERDQEIECMACGSCEEPNPRNRFCTDRPVQPMIDSYIERYRAANAVTFAIVGDIPNGCRQPGARDDFEPGQGYVDVANGTGGQFGSICGDMRRNLQDVARVAGGVASSYRLTAIPASATLRAVVGRPGQGRVIERSRVNGFDYDPVQNTIVFYGDARPKDGEEIAIAYRRWDWKGGAPGNPGPTDDPTTIPHGRVGGGDPDPGNSNPNGPGGDADRDGIPNGRDTGDSDGDGIPDYQDQTPGGTTGTPGEPDPGAGNPGGTPTSGGNGGVEPCDQCGAGLSCEPTSDLSNQCVAICGDVYCNAGEVCLLDTATCGSPGQQNPPPPATSCPGGCSAGMVCDPRTLSCVPTCESSGCSGANQVCNMATHLCEVPGF